MGSIWHNGVQLQIYPEDHLPKHVHCKIGGTRVILELLNDRTVRVADRRNAARNAKKSELNKAVEAAAERFDDLIELWEKMHG